MGNQRQNETVNFVLILGEKTDERFSRIGVFRVHQIGSASASYLFYVQRAGK